MKEERSSQWGMGKEKGGVIEPVGRQRTTARRAPRG